MAKGDKFYYDNFENCAELAKKAASNIADCLKNYDPDRMETMLKEMHEIETAADMLKHEMNAALAKAFVTPVDREDLDLLSGVIDDLVDLIEEILQKFYIYDIKTIHPSAVEFADKIVKACEILCKIMAEFENFKKSKNMKALIIEINDVEEDCDKIYLQSMRDLTVSSKDVLEIISWQKIFEILESCADACEHVSDCVASVVMKNT